VNAPENNFTPIDVFGFPNEKRNSSPLSASRPIMMSLFEVHPMYPADIEEVTRLCRRIVEEQDPQSFSSLVEALNTQLEDDGEKNQPNPKGYAA